MNFHLQFQWFFLEYVKWTDSVLIDSVLFLLEVGFLGGSCNHRNIPHEVALLNIYWYWFVTENIHVIKNDYIVK